MSINESIEGWMPKEASQRNKEFLIKLDSSVRFEISREIVS
jgi:hypothetical protein